MELFKLGWYSFFVAFADSGWFFKKLRHLNFLQ